MIAASERALGIVDANTKIVPGHGPLGDRAALQRYRSVLVTVRDKVSALKSSGKSLAEAMAAKPTADLDPEWGRGFMNGDGIVTVVYNSL